jgi:signal recognition particle subunit SRP54
MKKMMKMMTDMGKKSKKGGLGRFKLPFWLFY